MSNYLINKKYFYKHTGTIDNYIKQLIYIFSNFSVTNIFRLHWFSMNRVYYYFSDYLKN
jgi:hypothetical protein